MTLSTFDVQHSEFTPTEEKAVQARMLEYAKATGSTVVSRQKI
jgi:hypothetical protein